MSISEPTRQQFEALCFTNGFVRRGNTFFRIHGDGVLQILKIEKTRHFPVYEICFGLLSMYGELRPEWFTARGCITRYFVVNFLGKDGAVYLRNMGEYYQTGIISMEEQMETLEGIVMPFLDHITSQARLAEALCKMDERIFSCVIWNDGFKYAPYLHSENYELASKVMQAILDQRQSAFEQRRESMSAQEFREYYLAAQESNRPFMQKLDMAKEGNKDAIQEYLHSNYVHNIALAKFILKHKNTGRQ